MKSTTHSQYSLLVARLKKLKSCRQNVATTFRWISVVWPDRLVLEKINLVCRAFIPISPWIFNGHLRALSVFRHHQRNISPPFRYPPIFVSIWITRLKRFIFAVFRRIGISQSLLQYTAVRRWWECRMPDQTSDYSKPLSFLWLTSDFCLSVWNLPCPQRKFFLYPLTRKWGIPQSHATYSKQRIFSPWILLAFPLLHWFLNTYFCMFGHTIPEADFSVNHLLSTPDTRI